MIKVNSKVTINTKKIAQLTRAQIIALEHTAEELHTDVQQAQVMPFDTGALQGDGKTFVDYSNSSKGKVSIVSTGPYARRVYYHPEFNFKKTENPNAKGHWYDDWITGNKKAFVNNTFKKVYKGLTGL